MVESSTGTLVLVPATAPAQLAPATTSSSKEEVKDDPAAEVDRDILCPICMQVIKEAFATPCGHSFCHACISSYLGNKNDCPSCAQHLTADRIFPNFLLDKILKKSSARQNSKSASPLEICNQALQQGCEVSMSEVDSLMSLLAEKKRKMEKERGETSTRLLLEFLQCLRNKKFEDLNEVHADLQYIKEDMINTVERHKMELCMAKERHKMELCMAKERQLVKFRMFTNDYGQTKACHPLNGRHISGTVNVTDGLQGGVAGGELRNVTGETNSQGSERRDAYCGISDAEFVPHYGLAVARKKRLCTQFNELQDYYLQKRRHWARKLPKQGARNVVAMDKESYNPSLEDFKSVLFTYTRYSQLKVVAELRHANIFHSPKMISSIEFDRDDEYFATAGYSRCIKVFEFSTVVDEPSAVHCPVVEISTRSGLTCLSWNKCTKSHIASSDYGGIVNIWDVTTHQSMMEYVEHERRTWSVDFSCTDPSLLVSGGDDCKVKIWCSKQEASVFNIDMRANVCSVKFNPGSSTYVAVGSADHHIYSYDLRNTNQPLHVLSGHQQAVSYVRFLSNNELASASTDNSLRLWDVKENIPVRTFRGHTHEKHFVGLTGNSNFIACGSETNEVFVYHKAISKPMASHSFGSLDMDRSDNNVVVSAVCWKSDNTLLTANNRGTINVLELVP